MPSRRAALVAVPLAVALAAPAGAAPTASAARTTTDAAFVSAVDAFDPRVRFLATAIRRTVAGTNGTRDTLVVCLSYRAGRLSEAGCATGPGRAVTTGTGVPDGAVIRVRVPVHGRRGGWIEADLRLVARGTPWIPPATYDRWLRPAGATVAVSVGPWIDADVTGWVRTDRGLRIDPLVAPETFVPTSVARTETFAAGADA
ncbi:MAG TPA: hypothetical protein VF519_04590 [Mycobacteriales bacterium]